MRQRLLLWTTRTVLLVTTSLVAIGCVKKSEIITVMPDGKVWLAAGLNGDRSEIEGGPAALPSKAGGWAIYLQVGDEEGDGEKEPKSDDDGILIAAQAFPPFRPLPTSYAVEPQAQRHALQFPTEVTIEDRPDGTYYHFRRVYKGRRVAWVQYWQHALIENDDTLKDIRDKNRDGLTAEERTRLAKALIGVEAHKTTQVMQAAVDQLPGGIPQDAWLKAYQAVMDVYLDDQIVNAVVKQLTPDTGTNGEEMTDNPDDESTNALDHKLREDARNAIRAQLTSAAIAPERIEAFFLVFDDVQSEFAVTEDLGNDDWEVTVQLPGKIIAHNASNAPDALSEDLEVPDEHATPEFRRVWKEMVEDVHCATTSPAGMEEVSWDFDFEAISDRDMVLAATSFVPREPQADGSDAKTDSTASEQ